MDAEQRGWLVLVRAGEEGKFSFATGFPITQRHVLTALHVLLEHVGSERPKTEAERAELRSKLLKTPLILRLPHKDRQKDYRAKVVWDGLERGLDALLLTAADAGDAPRFGRWGPVALRPPGADTRWQSEAWSQGGIESTEGEARRESVPLIGTVPGEVMPGQRLQLNADPAFVDKDDWRGASGSPVFVHGVICGILESYWTRMENSFHAVPMAGLLADQRFLAETGLGSDEGYIERIRRCAGSPRVVSGWARPKVKLKALAKRAIV